MTRLILVMVFAVMLVASAAQAQQQSVWVQIEAQPSLTAAQKSARSYARDLQDVNGFSLGGGWYAVALGPYTTEEAAQVLRVLRAERVIPRDSYIAQSSDFQQQFWPVGASLLTQPTLTEPTQTETTLTETTLAQPIATAAPEPAVTAPAPEPEPVDETPRQARASERELTREDRANLQTALKWAGFYGGGIDAAFGQGTRGAMSRWQEANFFDPTGVLTSRQRAELLRQYNAVLEGLDLELIHDAAAGIEIKMPTGVVAFEKYEPPFAHYSAQGDIDARVLLISQQGDENTLAGLYDIMQTLEIVPETGPRMIKDDSFTLIGEGALFISYTQAWLKQGEIKGFTLIWPAGDEERRTRLLGEMQESFTRTDAVLDPAAGTTEDQRIDLVSGLEIRKPRLSRSGFYVDRSGTVVTTADVVQACSKITIDQDYEATVVSENRDTGIAVLRPQAPLAPISVAAFQQSVPRLQSDVAVSGYSYGGLLGAPTLTFGQLADLRGLNGEERLKRLALAALDGDAGGPVMDVGGAVLGMLLPAGQNGRKLPEDVSFATDVQSLQEALSDAGVSAVATSDLTQIPAEALTRRAANMTVLVSCWE